MANGFVNFDWNKNGTIDHEEDVVKLLNEVLEGLKKL